MSIRLGSDWGPFSGFFNSTMLGKETFAQRRPT